ncbi:MAG TPA: Xaa-Pro aminopeptidase [Gammaproteobacteria bacterium]
MKAIEFARRRKQLMRAMERDSIAVIPAAPEKLRNRDVYYPYRQDSDFLYLSGFNEPEAVIVLVPEREQGEFILFCREGDPKRALWDGAHAGQEGAIRDYGADDSFPISDMDDILPGLLENREKVFCTMGRYPEFDHQLMEWVNRIKLNSRSGIKAPAEFVSLEFLLHEMRLFKSQNEQRALQKAAQVSSGAHVRAMQFCRPGRMEYEIEAALLYEFKKHNMEPAYPSIVGGGANACVLHYRRNSDELQDGDLLLIDAGAEYDGYAADISRTFPINGRFSPLQKEIYEIVLQAQSAAIEKAIPGNHWNDPHDAAVRELTGGLIELGVLKGSRPKLIKEGAYRPYYMHRTGHWLGMDVHDVGDYKVDTEWRLLEPGMTFTVEPGLYFTPDKNLPVELHNIGIRIEDDVLVTRTGNSVLTAAAPKSVAAIEALMSTANG